MRSFWARFSAYRAGVVAGVFVLALIVIMLAAWLLPGPDPHAITPEVMLAPSIDHPLGPDELGRDVLVSIVHGVKVSLSVGFAAALGATVIGILVGSVAGLYGAR